MWVVVEALWAAGMGLPAASPYGVGVRDPWFWRAAGCAASTDPCRPALPSSLCTLHCFFLLFLPAAFFRVHGQGEHKDVEGVSGVVDVHYIGVGQVEQFFADGGHPVSPGIPDGVIPLQEVPFHGPAVEIDGKFRRKQGQFLADPADVPAAFIQFEFGQQGDDFFFHQAQFVALGVADLQTVAPGQLAFHHIDGIAVFVVDVIAVEPGKDPLTEQEFHGRTSLFGSMVPQKGAAANATAPFQL